MKLEETTDGAGVFKGIMTDEEKVFRGRVDAILKHAEYYRNSIEANEYESALDQLLQLKGQTFQSIVEMQVFMKMEQHTIKFERNENRQTP